MINQVYLIAGMALGMFVAALWFRAPTSLTMKFAAWNWPSFGAGLAFAVAMFFMMGKLVWS